MVDVVDGDAFLLVVQTDQVPHHLGDIVSYGRGMAHALPGYDVQRVPGRRGDPQHHTGAGLQLLDIDGLAIDAHGHAGQLPGELAAIFQGQRKLLLVAPDGDILDLAACRLHQRSECQWRLEAEFAVQLVPPYLTQVVPPRIEEERVQQLPRAFHGRRIPRPQPAVDLDEGFFHGLGPFALLDRILGQGGLDRRIAVVQLEDLLVALIPQRAQQHGDRNFPGAVDAGGNDPVVVHLQF